MYSRGLFPFLKPSSTAFAFFVPHKPPLHSPTTGLEDPRRCLLTLPYQYLLYQHWFLRYFVSPVRKSSGAIPCFMHMSSFRSEIEKYSLRQHAKGLVQSLTRISIRQRKGPTRSQRNYRWNWFQIRRITQGRQKVLSSHHRDSCSSFESAPRDELSE